MQNIVSQCYILYTYICYALTEWDSGERRGRPKQKLIQITEYSRVFEVKS